MVFFSTASATSSWYVEISAGNFFVGTARAKRENKMVNHRINLSCSCHSSSGDTPESQPRLVSPSCSPCPTCQGHLGNPGMLLFLLSTSKDAPAPRAQVFKNPNARFFLIQPRFTSTAKPFSVSLRPRQKPQTPFKNWQRVQSQAGEADFHPNAALEVALVLMDFSVQHQKLDEWWENAARAKLE